MLAWSPSVFTASPWREFASLRVRSVRYPSELRQPRHRHGEPGLSLVLSGEVEESGPTASFRAATGSAVFKPAGCWHADHYGPTGAVVLQLTPRCEQDDHWAAIRWQYRWTEAARLTRSMLLLLSEGIRHREQAELAFWEALSAMVLEPLADVPRWWPAALDLVETSLEHSISIAEVARAVDVHPTHLTRVCRRQLGCSMRHYLLERRTLAAWRRATAGEPLATVAANLRFADQSHMTRAFVRLLGVSPARLRRLSSTPG